MRRNVAFMPMAATAAMFGSQCSSLLELHIVPMNVGLAGADIAALAVLTRLTRLKVRLSISFCPP